MENIEEILTFGQWLNEGMDFNALMAELSDPIISIVFLLWCTSWILRIFHDLSKGANK